MRIGVAGPFNPTIIKGYLDDIDIPEINVAATSVNNYILGLLEEKQDVVVFTCAAINEPVRIIEGNHIKVYICSSKHRVRGLGRVRMPKRIRKYINVEIETLDVLHAEWTYEYAYAIKKYAKIRPIYCSVRDWCPYLLTLKSSLRGKYNLYMCYYMFRKVMKEKKFCFIANSMYTYNQIHQAYPAHRVEIIPNPLMETSIIESRTTYPEQKTFITINQSLTEKRKNIVNLLYAYKKYRAYNGESKLLMVGSYSDEWKVTMEKEGLLEGVSLLGHITHEQVLETLDHSTCLVHPAIEETFGNILLEAMCRRVICIGGQDAGAVPQVLGNGKYGILCDVTNPDSICGAMLQSEDKMLYETIVDNCMDYIRSTYTERIIARRHVDLFKMK